jgi:hypothetical protein
MAVFESTERLYEVLGGLFKTLLADPDFGPRYSQADLSLYFEIFDPPGEIWITKEGKVICGHADFEPTVTMILSGDTCHKFWLQEIDMPMALANRMIEVKGPMPKVVKLLPLLKPAYDMYPDHAREHGIDV